MTYSKHQKRAWLRSLSKIGTDQEKPPKRRKGQRKPKTEAQGFNRNSVILSLVPDPHLAADLAVPGGEHPSTLHLTLVHYGRVGLNLTHDDVETIKNVCASIAEQQQALHGVVNGTGKFVNEEGRTNAWWAHVDMPRLVDFRQAVITALKHHNVFPNAQYGFTPHITIAYSGRRRRHGSIHATYRPISFDAIEVWVGRDHTRIPFGRALTREGETRDDRLAFP